MKMYKKIMMLTLSVILAACSGCTGGNGKGSSSLDKVDLVNKENFVERTVYPEDDGGVYTIYQNNDTYRASLAIDADAAMVFGSGYNMVANQISDWLNRGFDSVAVMVPMGRDHGSVYIRGAWPGDPTEHTEIIATTANGAYRTHPTPGEGGNTTYYVYPSQGYAEFVADYCIQGIRAGADAVYIEEPDGWIDSFYNQTFYDRWKKEYGTDWNPANVDDPEDIVKRDYIISRLYIEAYDTTSRIIKQQYPNVKVYVCTHSISNYIMHGIAVDNYEILQLPGIDGLVAQAWSDTSLAASFPLNGSNGVHAFEYSYMEYSEMLNYARENGKAIFTLSDPKSDNSALNQPDSEPLLREVYTENVIAQLIDPGNNRFELLPWPNRAFASASYEYKGLQEVMHNISNNAHKQDAVGYAGTEGIGVVTSTTLMSNTHDAAGRTSVSTYGLTGMATTLISEGIPVEMLTLEAFNTPGYLDGIHTMVLSYDIIKPLLESYADSIAKWVKDGGSLILVGGTSVSSATIKGWWKDGYASAEDALFAKLGVDCTAHASIGSRPTLERKVNASYLPESVSVGRGGYTVTGWTVGKNANVLYEGDGNAIVWEQNAGSGHVIVCGVSPSYFGSGETTYELLEGLVIRSCAFKNVEYHAPKMMRTIRGNVEIIKTFARSYTLKGTFVDLTSVNFEVVTDPVIDEYSYGMYAAVGNAEGVVFANGRMVEGAVKGSSSFSFTTSNNANSKVQAAIYLKGINGTPAVRIVTENGDDITSESGAELKKYGDVIYVTYRQMDKYPLNLLSKGAYKVTITLTW